MFLLQELVLCSLNGTFDFAPSILEHVLQTPSVASLLAQQVLFGKVYNDIGEILGKLHKMRAVYNHVVHNDITTKRCAHYLGLSTISSCNFS